MTLYDFSAGPSPLIKEVQEQLIIDIQRGVQGHNILSLSHRSPLFEDILQKTIHFYRSLLNVPKDYEILFFHGGASLQMSAIFLNLRSLYQKVLIIDSGYWSNMVKKEASKYMPTESLSMEKLQTYTPKNNSFIYYVSNETTSGLRLPSPPIKSTKAFFVSDMTSDILSRKINYNQHPLLFFGNQKNTGIVGMSTIFIQKDHLVSSKNTPKLMDYHLQFEKKNRVNTPPILPIYTSYLTLNHLLKNGYSIETLERESIRKSNQLYNVIDSSSFYTNSIDKSFRSTTNITFSLPSEELQELFLSKSTALKLLSLRGHPSFPVIRVSLYLSMPDEGIKKLIDFMKEFENQFL